MRIKDILVAKEGERFEFKAAGNRFSFTELQKYVSAISNEGGGRIVFGVSNERPRQVVGSRAFEQPERTRKGLIEDFRAVRCVLDGKPMPRELKPRVSRLVGLGVLEKVDRSRLVMAQKYYQAIGRAGDYTRLRGIGDQTCLELLCQHMRNEKNRGLRLIEFSQVLPSYSPRKIQRLLNNLAKKGKAKVEGRTKGAKWYLTESELTVD